MATLTETAYYTRRILLFGAILLVSFISLKIALTFLIDAWRRISPPSPPPPTVAYGKLPKIKFPDPKNTEDIAKLNFRLETIEGSLPSLPKIERIYFVPKKNPAFLALDRAGQLVKTMGFTNAPEKVSENIYRWKNDVNPPTTLDMDILRETFHLRYQYENDQAILAKKTLPTDQEAIDESKKFLKSLSLLKEDLATGSAEVKYFRFQTPTLVPAASLSEADFVRVDLFRIGLNGFNIFPPDPKQALIFFIFSGSRELGKRIVEVQYNYSQFDKESFSTYPLRPVEEAWNEVQSKKAYIANLGENTTNEIVIRRVYIGYYESDEPQEYLQPIYVFEGEKNFFAYSSALSSQWTE